MHEGRRRVSMKMSAASGWFPNRRVRCGDDTRESLRSSKLSRSAGWQPAIQQTGSLRYMSCIPGFLCSLCLLLFSSSPARSAAPTFEKDIRPILKAHCFDCHGEGEKLKGGVDLRLRRLMLTGGDNGAVL